MSTKIDKDDIAEDPFFCKYLTQWWSFKKQLEMSPILPQYFVSFLNQE